MVWDKRAFDNLVVDDEIKGLISVLVTNYLESVLHLGKIWDCVVLLDEAVVFLEERGLADLQRNALVSVFLRVLRRCPDPDLQPRRHLRRSLQVAHPARSALRESRRLAAQKDRAEFHQLSEVARGSEYRF